VKLYWLVRVTFDTAFLVVGTSVPCLKALQLLVMELHLPPYGPLGLFFIKGTVSRCKPGQF